MLLALYSEAYWFSVAYIKSMSTDNNPTEGSGGSSAAAAAAAMLNQPIVIDCGTSSMKAGFAGGTKPKVNILFHFC